MSDAQTPDSPTMIREPEPTPQPKKRGWLWLLIGGAILGALLGVSGQRWWTELTQDAAPNDIQANAVDGRLNALEATLANQEAQRQELLAMQQNLQRERTLLLLDRIDQQLNAGQQVWALTGNTKPLNNALQSAVDSLQNQPGAAMQALRLAVGRDLAALKAAPVVDIPAALSRLDALAASIDTLPLIQDQRVPAPVPETAAPPEAAPETWSAHARQWLGNIGHDIWQALRGMVRVQRLDRAEPGLIAPEQKVFLQESLRLRLLDARHALVTRDNTRYQQSLKEARGWLEKYMDSASQPVKAALENLQQLSAVNIEAAPVLSQTEAALVQARAALGGLPLADGADAPPLTPPAAVKADEAKVAPQNPPPAQSTPVPKTNTPPEQPQQAQPAAAPAPANTAPVAPPAANTNQGSSQ